MHQANFSSLSKIHKIIYLLGGAKRCLKMLLMKLGIKCLSQGVSTLLDHLGPKKCKGVKCVTYLESLYGHVVWNFLVWQDVGLHLQVS